MFCLMFWIVVDDASIPSHDKHELTIISTYGDPIIMSYVSFCACQLTFPEDFCLRETSFEG